MIQNRAWNLCAIGLLSWWHFPVIQVRRGRVDYVKYSVFHPRCIVSVVGRSFTKVRDKTYSVFIRVKSNGLHRRLLDLRANNSFDSKHCVGR